MEGYGYDKEKKKGTLMEHEKAETQRLSCRAKRTRGGWANKD